MKKNTFKVLFYIRGNRLNKDGQATIMLRITVDGELEQLSTKLTVNPNDKKFGQFGGNCQLCK